MKPEAITKLTKAAVVLATIAGVEVSPEKITAIIEAAGLVLSALYSVEAWLKNRGAR